MHRAKSKLFPWEKQSWKQPRVSLSKVLGGQRTWRRLCLPGPNVFLCKRGRKERLGFGTEADKGILWNPSDLEMNWHLHQGLPVELYPEVNPCYVGDAWWLVLNIPACSSFRKRMEEAEVLNGTVTLKETQGHSLSVKASSTGHQLPQDLTFWLGKWIHPKVAQSEPHRLIRPMVFKHSFRSRNIVSNTIWSSRQQTQNYCAWGRNGSLAAHPLVDSRPRRHLCGTVGFSEKRVTNH